MAQTVLADAATAFESPDHDSALHGLSEQARESVFAPYRERILYPIAAAGTLILLPLAALHLVQGDVQVAALIMLLVAMLGADAIAIARRKRPPVPFELLLMPAAASILLALPEHTMQAALWSYPMVMFSYFVLPRRLANATSVSFLGMASCLMALHVETGTAVRFALTLGFSIMVVNIILNVLDALHARLLALSILDPLTGAFNRRHMEHALGDALERRRRSGCEASVLLVDVDRFKSINDRFGHGVGDQVLRDLARRLRERARRLDTLFRIGGEEFVLLLPDTRRDDAVKAAEHVRRHIARHCAAGGQRVTVSIGVAEARPDDELHGWLQRADQALYRAKNTGRDRVAA